MSRSSGRNLSLLGLALGAIAVAFPGGREPAVAGCLAPFDSFIDGNNAGGLLDGNASGTILYSRDQFGLGNDHSLVRRFFGQAGDPMHIQGQSTGFVVGSSATRWSSFRSGSINESDDVAFVALTNADEDNPATPVNEAVLGTALFGQRNNTLFRIARRSESSPFLGNLGQPIPWASLFDPQVLERDDVGGLEVVFRGELQPAPGTIIAGLYRWSQSDDEITTIAQAGSPAPSGGNYDTVVRSRGNGGGDVAFFATARLNENTTTPGLFLVPTDAAPVRVVKLGVDGDPAPGGGTFSILGAFDIDDQRVLTFAAAVSGAPSPTGLFRASPPNFIPEVVLREGDTTPLGGVYETFSTAQIHAAVDGELALKVEISDDAGGGDGLFTVAAGTNDVTPLADTDGALSIASIGQGRIAYKEPDQTRTVVPSDGSEEGPTDFRIVKLDVRNAVALRSDVLICEGRLRLPNVGTGAGEAPPAVFRTVGNARNTPTGSFGPAELTRISQVRMRISRSPGNTFHFGLTGDEAKPTGTLQFNGIDQKAPKVKLDKDGDRATWRFSSADRAGALTVDLGTGTFKLRVTRANVQGLFKVANFNVDFTLRTLADVVAGEDPQDSFFHRTASIDADFPSFGGGSRVRSKGERVDGGTLFVDSVKVKRKLKVQKGQAAPNVSGDDVLLKGTLRLCPGAAQPSTPGLDCDLTFGSVRLTGVVLQRAGKSTRYQYSQKSGPNGRVDLRVDVSKGTFQLKVKGGPVHTGLVDADFSTADGPNGFKTEVGGMVVPFSLSISRVYEASYDVPVVRRKGGKLFVR